MKKALLIDGNSILNRSFYGIRNMSTGSGFPTNAIYGFLKTFNRIFDMFNPDYVAVAFDLKAKTFRHNMYSEYKGNRKSMPDDLRLQMPVIKELLKLKGISIAELEGFEADDIIGFLSKEFSKENVHSYILSGDRDLMQLVNDKVSMYYPSSKNEGVFDQNRVIEVMGIEPSLITDLKGLMGDSSDNIPGVKGVGEKTALKLLKEYGSLEEILNNLDKIKAKKLREKLEEDFDMAILSKKLATIETNLPIEFELSEYLLSEIDFKVLKESYLKYELKSLLSTIDKKNDDTIEVQTNNEYFFNDFDKVNLFNFEEPIYFDLIRDYDDIFIKKVDFFVMYQEKKVALVFDEKFSNKIGELILNQSKKTIIKIKAYNSKKVMLFFRAFGIENYEVYYDYEIASYVINPNLSSYNVSADLMKFLGENIESLDTYYKKSSVTKAAQTLDVNKISKVLADRIYAVYKTEKYIIDELKELEMLSLYLDIDLKLARLLVDMQISGFKVDEKILNKIGKELDAVITELEGQIYFSVGQTFNINSPKQLGVVLFEDLGLKPLKKTKTGYSTSKDILEKKIDEHPVVKMILDYRAYTKLRSTYVYGLKPYINKSTKKIHSYLMQTIVATGRISSVNPNMQNIPLRYEMGRKLRKAFVPSDENHILISADYSQIELRLLAHLSNSKELIAAFNENKDIHTITASKVFEVDEESVTKELRTRAKAVNFGVVYGIGSYSLSEDLDISFEEANDYIENYFEKYPMIKTYLDNLKKDASEKGYAETLYGRKRNISELFSNKYMTRMYGERIAMNSPIQGTASDIIKIAMINLANKMKENNLKSKLILQVHDELIIDAHKDEVLKLKELMIETMTNYFELSVKLYINISSGKDWYEAK
ncbi:MAG: DNA polymerase I [Clostridiales bacterium]|nr:MAG: DNA polymerase I [Clostridiales bacterium]